MGTGAFNLSADMAGLPGEKRLRNELHITKD